MILMKKAQFSFIFHVSKWHTQIKEKQMHFDIFHVSRTIEIFITFHMTDFRYDRISRWFGLILQKRNRCLKKKNETKRSTVLQMTSTWLIWLALVNIVCLWIIVHFLTNKSIARAFFSRSFYLSVDNDSSVVWLGVSTGSDMSDTVQNWNGKIILWSTFDCMQVIIKYCKLRNRSGWTRAHFVCCSALNLRFKTSES